MKKKQNTKSEQLSWLETPAPDAETILTTEAEQLCMALTDKSFEGMYIIQDGLYQFINETAAGFLGYPAMELIGRRAKDFMHPDDLERARENARRMLREGHDTPHSFRIIDKEENAKSVLETVQPILFRGRQAILGKAIQLAMTDGTAEAVRHIEERAHTLLDNIEEGYIETDLAGRFSYVNETFRNTIGYSRNELWGMHYRTYTDEEDRVRVYEAYNSVFRTGRPVKWLEHNIRCKDGSRRIIELSVYLRSDPLGNPLGFRGIARDVTWRKEMESALRQSEERYRALMDNVELGITWISKDFEVILVNRAQARMYEKTPADFIGQKCYRLFEKSESVCSHCAGVRAMQEKKQMTVEATGVRDDGSTFSAALKAFPVFGPDGEVTGFIEISEDISAREKAEAALHQSEERFARIFQVIPVPTAITTPFKGRIVDVNESMLTLLGYERSEILGRTSDDLNLWIGPTDRSGLRQKFQEENRLREEPIQCRTKNGDIKDILWSAEIIQIEGKDAILSLFHDVTDRKRGEQEKQSLQLQLQQAHKMEAVGTLAGGIAHDFNNILASIIGFTEMTLHRDLPADSRARHNLEQVLNAADRAKDLVHQILAFSRRQAQTQRPIQIIPIVKEALRLLRASLPSTIELHTFFSARDNTILAEPVQIQQILMNLCSNAAHAMNDHGGVLEIRLSNTEMDMIEAKQNDLSPGRYLQLSIRDTGRGIDPEIISRIFDPFFTTKAQGEGTGLGLSVVYGIVKSSGGAIAVRSHPGVGSVFDVYFPIIKESADGARLERNAPSKYPGGKETILYVDDEESLAILGKEMLSHLGYTVIPCYQSTDALTLFQADPGRFDLVITDYTMPAMTGTELARKMIEIRSDIPIILSTGFSPSITKEKVQEIGIREFITKPISIRDLALVIRKVLDKKDDAD